MNEQPPLLLSNYFVEKLEYEAIPGFNPANPAAEELSVDPDVFLVPDKPHDFMVRLKVNLAGPPKSNSGSRLHFSLIGFFRVREDVPEKLRQAMVFQNAPSILFGIARQITVEMTGNGPYGKFVLPTVNFLEVMRRKTEALPGEGSAEFKVSDKPSTHSPRLRRGKTHES